MANLLCSLRVTEYLRQTVQSCDGSFTCDGAKVLLNTCWQNIWMQLQEAKSQRTEQRRWQAIFFFLCGAMRRVNHHSVNNYCALNTLSHKRVIKAVCSTNSLFTTKMPLQGSRRSMTEENINRCLLVTRASVLMTLPWSWPLK